MQRVTNELGEMTLIFSWNVCEQVILVDMETKEIQNLKIIFQYKSKVSDTSYASGTQKKTAIGYPAILYKCCVIWTLLFFSTQLKIIFNIWASTL